jgi:hypothetical protein
VKVDHSPPSSAEVRNSGVIPPLPMSGHIIVVLLLLLLLLLVVVVVVVVVVVKSRRMR